MLAVYEARPDPTAAFMVKNLLGSDRAAIRANDIEQRPRGRAEQIPGHAEDIWEPARSQAINPCERDGAEKAPFRGKRLVSRSGGM